MLKLTCAAIIAQQLKRTRCIATHVTKQKTLERVMRRRLSGKALIEVLKNENPLGLSFYQLQKSEKCYLLNAQVPLPNNNRFDARQIKHCVYGS